MKKMFKIISKLVLFLVVFGFFQPVACDTKGFQLAKNLLDCKKFNYTAAAIGLYLTFFAAILSIAFIVVLFVTKRDICDKKADNIDSLFVAVGLAGVIITFVCIVKEFNADMLNRGSYLMLSGWIASLLFLILSRIKRS